LTSALSERLNRPVAWLRTVVARPPAPSRRSQRLLVAGSAVLFGGAAIVMLLARAASLVPMRGGTIVQIGSLEQAGATYPWAIFATGAVGLTWMGIGVRQIVAGVLGASIGLPAPLSVIATVPDRLVKYAVLVPVGLAVWLGLEPVDRPHVSLEAVP
jgi:hypothetical protein